MLLAVVAIVGVMLLPSVSAQSTGTLPAPGPVRDLSTSGLTSATSSTPHLIGPSVHNRADSQTLAYPGVLSVFGMANGGTQPSTGFSSGDLVNAVDRDGNVAAALAVTQETSDNYTTSDSQFSIGGFAVSGFQYYGEKTKVSIPPVQATTTLTEKLVLPESAFVVLIALSGGQNTILMSGVPGLVIESNGTGGTWSGVLIGESQLASGTYSFTETSTNHDGGGQNRADVLGIFAFSNSRAGFIDREPAYRVVTSIPVGYLPSGVAYDPAKGEFFVAVSDVDEVTVISATTNKVVTSIPVPYPEFPSYAAYDSAK